MKVVILPNVLLWIVLSALRAQTVTFEPNAAGELPDGSVAKDNLAVADQFLLFGVSFGLDNNYDGIADPGKTPFLERAGDDESNGFQNDSLSSPDKTAAGLENQLGQYFLRTRSFTSPGGGVDALLITYTTPVAIASGEIWDLDSDTTLGTERWRIEAIDGSGEVAATVDSPVGINHASQGTLDGRPWNFEITSDTGSSISALRIRFIGSKTMGVGLAFNNFSPSSPTPPISGELKAKVTNAVEISWVSKVGQRYQVQWTASLTSPKWNDLGAVVVGNGVEISVFDSSRGTDQRFYRIGELED